MVAKLSHVCLAHPLRCCKKKTNTNKPRQTRQEAHRKKNKPPCTPRPHNVATNSRISSFALLSGRTREPEPLRFLRALRWSRPSTLSWCRFALASLGDARDADVLRLVVVKQAAVITVEPPATSSLTDVAMRGLWRSVLMAQFTARSRRGAPLRCVELLGSAATHVPSFLCCVCPLFVCPCAFNLHYCGAPRCLTCTIAGSASIVQVLHYRGRCLCPEILPALYQAPALFNLHYRGPSTVAGTRRREICTKHEKSGRKERMKTLNSRGMAEVIKSLTPLEPPNPSLYQNQVVLRFPVVKGVNQVTGQRMACVKNNNAER